jgi:hypothetical protein
MVTDILNMHEYRDTVMAHGKWLVSDTLQYHSICSSPFKIFQCCCSLIFVQTLRSLVFISVKSFKLCDSFHDSASASALFPFTN